MLNDDQRRRLAMKGKILGRKMLKQVATIVSPDTILRWHRELVIARWDYSRCRMKIGRPPVSAEVVEVMLRLARENPSWGYDRIQGALANLDHLISDRSVGNILKAHGIDPAPDRKRQSTWKCFLQCHWDVLASLDFTAIEVWTKSGWITIYLLFSMGLGYSRNSGPIKRKMELRVRSFSDSELAPFEINRNPEYHSTGTGSFSSSKHFRTAHLLV